MPPVSKAHQNTAARWKKVSDFFFIAAHIMAPIAEYPLVNLIANPIMNGLFGCWYATSAIAFKYNPALKNKETPRHREQYDKAQSAFNIASYVIGGIATVAALLVFVPPLWPIAPILLSIAAIATTASSVLRAVGTAMDLYKEFKYGINDAGHAWRVRQHALTLLHNIGTIVIAGLIVASFFTPVGWAAGAGVFTFAVAASISILAVFTAAKFCQWQASRAVYKEEHPKNDKLIDKQAPVIKPKEKPEYEFELGPKPHELLPEFNHERDEKHAQMMRELNTKLKDKTKGREEKEEGTGDKDGSGDPPFHP